MTGAAFAACRFLLNKRATAPRVTSAITPKATPAPMLAFAPELSPGRPVFDGVTVGDKVISTGFEELVAVGFGKI